jgi:hypothetical protein
MNALHHVMLLALSINIDPTLAMVIMAALMAAVPPVAMRVSRWILNLNAKIDAMKPVYKQIISGFVGALLAVAALHFPGIPIPSSLTGFDANVVASLLSAGLTWFLHHVAKQKEAGVTA